MKLFQVEWPLARAAWKTADPRLFQVTPPEPVERLTEDLPTAFGALVRSIAHQQLSIYAGRAIVTRLVTGCDGALEPERVLALSELDLLQVGFSRQKVRSVQALAAAAVDGIFRDIEQQTEKEVAERLVKLPGIGIWTVKMFCIAHLQRPDVFTGDDLGLREGVRMLDGRADPPTARDAERRAEVWSPYRSVAAVVLWDLVRRTRAERAPAVTNAQESAGEPTT